MKGRRGWFPFEEASDGGGARSAIRIRGRRFLVLIGMGGGEKGDGYGPLIYSGCFGPGWISPLFFFLFSVLPSISILFSIV